MAPSDDAALMIKISRLTNGSKPAAGRCLCRQPNAPLKGYDPKQPRVEIEAGPRYDMAGKSHADFCV